MFMKRFLNALSLATGILLMASLSGCGDKTVAVQGVKLSSPSLTLMVGDVGQLTATVTPDNATDPSVTWSSSNPAVASVNAGSVTGIAEGSATITVTTADGAKSATCLVTVNDYHAESVAISPAGDLAMAKGETQKLTATVSPEKAVDKTVRWSSSNESVVTVSTDGTVTAVGGGQADITVTTNDLGKTATIHVTVTVPCTGITLSAGEAVVYAGIPYTALTMQFTPEDCSDKSVTWSSADEKIARVSCDESGKITVLGVSEGTVTLTVTTKDGGFKANCKVKVLPTGTQFDDDNYGKFE